jgi:hypothetical protein
VAKEGHFASLHLCYWWLMMLSIANIWRQIETYIYHLF